MYYRVVFHTELMANPTISKYKSFQLCYGQFQARDIHGDDKWQRRVSLF